MFVNILRFIRVIFVVSAATFWNDPSEVLFDPRIRVETSTVDYVHLFGNDVTSDRRLRLPLKYRQMAFEELVVRALAVLITLTFLRP
jgi:hypothetical protein